jgi:uracil-DNA glycosylase
MALAVASEPCIFWRGEGAEDIIRQVAIPKAVGKLVPAGAQLNGPSGNALDDLFLRPLGFTREDAWLCDLVPHSCVNPKQQAAIARAYLPLVEKHGLPTPSVPPVPKVLADDARRQAILGELRESKAPLLVLLGDQPIKWFLRHFDRRWAKLSDFGVYGQRHQVELDGLEVDVLPLAHPRQAAKLGRSSEKWATLEMPRVFGQGDVEMTT